MKIRSTFLTLIPGFLISSGAFAANTTQLTAYQRLLTMASGIEEKTTSLLIAKILDLKNGPEVQSAIEAINRVLNAHNRNLVKKIRGKIALLQATRLKIKAIETGNLNSDPEFSTELLKEKTTAIIIHSELKALLRQRAFLRSAHCSLLLQDWIKD